MKIKHEILNTDSDLKKIRKEFLKSEADALFLQAEYVVLPENAINKLAIQLQGSIKCISGWVPINKEFGWNALKLVSDNTIAHIIDVQKNVTRVDYVTLECILIAREVLEKVKFNGKPQKELSWVTGFKIVTNLFMNFCNDMYDKGYLTYMNGDVVCGKIFPPDLPDVEDPQKRRKNDKVIVSFVADNQYVIPLAVAIKSLIDNFSQNRKLEIIVGSVGISDENKQKLNDIYPVKFIDLDMTEVKDIKINIVYHNESIFGRLVLLSMLKDYKKILYFDVDIVVKEDVSELWDIDVSSYTLAAVQDESIYERDGYVYFNSGVLLVNLDKWREKQVTKKAIKFVLKNITNFTDQDALNHILKKDFIQISRKWNRNPLNSDEELNIIHFLGSEKPWWYGSKMSIVPEYYRLIDITPFQGWRPSMPREKITII